MSILVSFRRLLLSLFLTLAFLLVAGCQGNETTAPSSTSDPSAMPSPTNTQGAPISEHTRAAGIHAPTATPEMMDPASLAATRQAAAEATATALAGATATHTPTITPTPLPATQEPTPEADHPDINRPWLVFQVTSANNHRAFYTRSPDGSGLTLIGEHSFESEDLHIELGPQREHFVIGGEPGYQPETLAIVDFSVRDSFFD